VREGQHYGYPYADGVRPTPKGTVAPLLVTTQNAFEGLTWAGSPRLPEHLRNCLYVVNFGPGNIDRICLTKQGQTYRAESHPFAKVPGAIDVTVDANGTFYVTSYGERKIYRVRQKDAP
jgi:glucose/arabinose dehydrogenase